MFATRGDRTQRRTGKGSTPGSRVHERGRSRDGGGRGLERSQACARPHWRSGQGEMGKGDAGGGVGTNEARPVDGIACCATTGKDTGEFRRRGRELPETGFEREGGAPPAARQV